MAGSMRKSVSEDLARASVIDHDFSLAAILRALDAADIPWNTSRKNVVPDGETGVHGMLLGFFVYSYRTGCSSQTTEHIWLTKLAAGYAKRTRPDFHFTSIQVNKNYASRPHVDKNNLGKSLILGLGDYIDGQIWVHDDMGDVTLELKEDIKSTQRYRNGKTYNGTILDCHDNFVEFDGNKLHYTLPFSGNRYTLIYFTSDMFAKASKETQMALVEAGLNFSWSCRKLQIDLQERVQQKEQMREEWRAKAIAEWREDQRKERTKLGRCFARTWNRGWGGACPHWRHKDDPFFCRSHGDARETWRTHGRIDDVIPALKKAEMLKWQTIMIGNGEDPPDPVPYGCCVLIPIPQWSLHTIIPGLEGYLPPAVVIMEDEEKEEEPENAEAADKEFESLEAKRHSSDAKGTDSKALGKVIGSGNPLKTHWRNLERGAGESDHAFEFIPRIREEGDAPMRKRPSQRGSDEMEVAIARATGRKRPAGHWNDEKKVGVAQVPVKKRQAQHRV